MATLTPILGIQEVAPTQTAKETTINDAIVALENAANEQKGLAISTTDVTVTTDDFTGNFLQILTGTPASIFNVIVPNTKRFFGVWNRTGHAQTIRTAAPATIVNVASGALAVIIGDGANNLVTVANSGAAGVGGGGATAFTGLSDVPASYVGKANQLVFVNPAATGLEFRPKADLVAGTVGTWTGAVTLSRTNGEIARGSLTGNTTFTITGWPTTGFEGRLVIEAQNTGAFNITWPGAVIWPGGVPPTVTSGSGKKDLYVLITFDGGTTIYGSVGGQNYA